MINNLEDSYTDFLRLSWASYGRMLDQLAFKVADRFERSLENKKWSVYGISRGGLLPSVYLSHKLDIDHKLYLTGNVYHNLLIVDDIVDSGATMEEHEPYLSEKRDVYYVSLLCKKSVDKLPEIYTGDLIDRDTWVVFPYE